MEELVDVVQILVRCTELPKGGAAVFTESGAFKAQALDLCDALGLKLPDLSESCAASLRQALPPFIPPSNPLDITAQGLVDPDLYRRTLPPILDDVEFGSVFLGIILTDPKTTQLKLPPIVSAIRSLKPRKLVVFAALDEGAPFDFPQIDEMRQLGIACFPSPERALRALAHLSHRATLQRNNRESDQYDCVKIESPQPGLMSEAESKHVLKQIGIRIPEGKIASNPEEAIRIAARIGYPVVLKAQSRDLPHKSDAGGVVLGIKSEGDLLKGWTTLYRSVQKAIPELVLDGVLVERMADGGSS
jgi:acyl-CoA synthetase (NDP forming)